MEATGEYKYLKPKRGSRYKQLFFGRIPRPSARPEGRCNEKGGEGDHSAPHGRSLDPPPAPGQISARLLLGPGLIC